MKINTARIRRMGIGFKSPLRQSSIKPRRRPRHFESQQQISFVHWFRLAYPQYAKIFFAIPNGGKRNKLEAGIMKMEGVLAGVPDLFLAKPTLRYSGLFMEGKFGDGRLTEKQEEVQHELRAAGYCVKTFRSLDEGISIVQEYLEVPILKTGDIKPTFTQIQRVVGKEVFDPRAVIEETLKKYTSIGGIL